MSTYHPALIAVDLLESSSLVFLAVSAVLVSSVSMISSSSSSSTNSASLSCACVSALVSSYLSRCYSSVVSRLSVLSTFGMELLPRIDFAISMAWSSSTFGSIEIKLSYLILGRYGLEILILKKLAIGFSSIYLTLSSDMSNIFSDSTSSVGTMNLFQVLKSGL